jgi:hypothetical protein
LIAASEAGLSRAIGVGGVVGCGEHLRQRESYGDDEKAVVRCGDSG